MLETEIKKLTEAVISLTVQVSNLSVPTVQAETPEKLEPEVAEEIKTAVDDMLDTTAKALAPEKEEVVEVPTVAELQAKFGKLAEKFEPGWVIAGIKHFGEGRLSDLAEQDRGKLSVLMTEVERRLTEDPTLAQNISPMDLVAEIANG